jgi:hypothetical protein
VPDSNLHRKNLAVVDPVRLYAEPIGEPWDGRNRWALIAEDAEGNRLTIVASGERFMDALQPRGLHGRMSAAEQAREMFVRDELPVEAFERVVEVELRK